MASPEHDNLEADLSAYLDGELSAARTQDVEHLLAESADARRTLEDLRQVRDQLATLPRVGLPAKLADSLIRRAEAELVARSAPAARRARLLRLAGPLTAVAAVLVMGLLIGYQALEPYLGTRSDLPPSAPRAERVAKSRPPEEPAFAARGGAAESKTPEGPAPAVIAQPKSFGHAAAPPPAADKSADAPAGVTPPETVLAEAPTEESTLASSVAVVIQTQHEADYVSNAAVLASWGAPAAGANQPIEQVYQLQAPELAYRLNQILAANPRGQVEVQQGRASEDSPVVAQVAEALGAPVERMGIPPEADAAGAGGPDSSLRPDSGELSAKSGAEPEKARQRLAGREADAKRDELHRRHMAVTEEPDLTIVLVEPPASPPARGLAPAAKKAAPSAEQSPKAALLDQLMGLLVRGGPRGGGQQIGQQSDQPITLRVRLLPPKLPPPAAPATTSPAAP